MLKHGYFAGCRSSSHVRRSSATSRRLLCPLTVTVSSDTQTPARSAMQPVMTHAAVQPAADAELFPWLSEQHDVAPSVHRLGSTLTNKPPTTLSPVCLRHSHSGLSTSLTLLVCTYLTLASVTKHCHHID